MRDDRQFIIDRFHEVKALGFVPSRRSSDTGIGKTFEDYVGVVENNLAEPDLAGYEIKSHRELSPSFVTMFTKSPDFPCQANRYIRDTFGVPDDDDPNITKFHASIFAHTDSLVYGRIKMRIENNAADECLYICAFNKDTGQLIDKSAGYKYSTIERKLQEKLSKLFFVTAQHRRISGVEEFYFDSAEIYTNPSLTKFLQMVDNGEIMFDFRIGSYKSGTKYGKPHDHGNGFRIKEENIIQLYANRESVI